MDNTLKLVVLSILVKKSVRMWSKTSFYQFMRFPTFRRNEYQLTTRPGRWLRVWVVWQQAVRPVVRQLPEAVHSK